jgi:hypothetical protein
MFIQNNVMIDWLKKDKVKKDIYIIFKVNVSDVEWFAMFLLSIYDSNESIDFVHGNPNIFIEILDELELFIDKKVIFDEKNLSVGSPAAVC